MRPVTGEEKGAMTIRTADDDAPPPTRMARRKQQTRAALIAAAQTFIAAGKLNVPVLEITQAADVGMGSFYNHFDSKDELFDAALTEALDAHGALLDALTAALEDPAEAFACSFRLTGRLFRQRPQECKILMSSGLSLLSSDRGVAPAPDVTSRRASRRAASTSPISALPWRSSAARCWALATYSKPNPTVTEPTRPTR